VDEVTTRFEIAPKVMIELLVKTEGITWAGWYSPENLKAKYDELCSWKSKGFGGGFSIVNEPGYLPGDRKRPSQRVLNDRIRCAWLRETGQA
jgi:hypothetical protein